MIPDSFNPVNVTDTCAVWHLVGAETLFGAARRANAAFIVTPTVLYECFVKTKGHPVTPERHELRAKLKAHIEGSRVTSLGLSISDLQVTMEHARRQGLDKKLGLGELSCAALARNLGSAAVLTDNKRDFDAIGALVDGRLQKTPQLLGWLFVEGHLSDGDVETVVREHKASDGDMSKVYRQAYRMACEKRLMRRPNYNGAGVQDG